MKVIDDHAKMITPNGAKKLIPLDQINFWIDNGIFEKVGYTFDDEEAGVKALKRWNDLKKAKAARRKLAKGTIQRDEGPAGAHTKVSPEPVGDEVEAIDNDGAVAYGPEILDQPPAQPAGDGEIPGIDVTDALTDEPVED
jgi:hypothetical protein